MGVRTEGALHIPTGSHEDASGTLPVETEVPREFRHHSDGFEDLNVQFRHLKWQLGLDLQWDLDA